MAGVATVGEPGRRTWLPILSWLPSYDVRRAGDDVLAGLVVAALAIPQSLGYAGIAGVPVQIGLYAIPLSLVAYALLGSSRILFVGPVSTVSVMSGSLVAGMLGPVEAEQRAVALTAALAIATGIVLVAAGLLRLGWAAEFLSAPIITGFVFGLVVLIVVGEVPNLLGVPGASGDVLERIGFLVGEARGFDGLTLAIGVAALVVLFLGARFAPRIPWAFVVLVASIALSSWLDLAADGVATVGRVPAGLPPVGLPGIAVGDLMPVLFGGVALALVGLGEGLSAARLFATPRDRVRPTQEFLATGAANVAVGLTSGMAVAGSLSKTATARRSGARSQAYGLLTAVVVVLVLVFFAGTLSSLPKAVLSAIVIQAVWGLMDVKALLRYRQVRRNDFVSALAALIGVLLLGPLYGLLAAIGQALLGVMYRSSRVDVDVMGKVPEEKAAWGNIRKHPERRTVSGVLVLRLDAPLFWANAEETHDRVLETLSRWPDTKALILDLEASNQLDTTSVAALDRLLRELRDQGVELYLVRCLSNVRRVLNASGFMDELPEGRLWHSISQGVRAARQDLGLKGHRPMEADADEAAVLQDYDAVEEVIATDPEDDPAEDDARR